jgi:hypothetical protein
MLTQVLFHFLLSVTKSHHLTIHILSVLFLPGVVIHELSHMLMASMLFVRVGEVEFLPQTHGNSVKLGSVQVAKTDPFRRFLIGAAPLIGGLLIIFLLYIYLLADFSHPFSWQTAVFLYALFEIGNTMFSSKKDMEGAVVLFIALAIISIILFFIGFRFDFHVFANLFSPSVTDMFQKLAIILLFPVVLNSIFCWGIGTVLKRLRIHIR